MLETVGSNKAPLEEKIIECRSYQAVADAIRDMIVRGAPAIGATAAFGIVIGAKEVGVIEDKKRWLEELKK